MKVAFAALLTLIVSAPGMAADPAPVAAPAYGALQECRTIAEGTARLACYDRNVPALIDAQKKGDLIIADRAEVRAAKKGLFGLSLPSIKLFGNDEINEVETTLVSASKDGYGQWQFVVESGGRWHQIDSEILYRDPKPGNKVVIKRAAFGSFRLKVENYPALRVRRER